MNSSTNNPADHVVLYDDDCGFCKWSLNWILRWDRRGRLRPVAIQSEEGERLLAGVDRALWLESWHLAMPDGQVASAGAGCIAVVDLMPCGGLLARLMGRFPEATERVYAAIAGNRDRLSRVLRIEATCQVRR